MIPALVVHCINEIEKRGLHEVSVSLHPHTNTHSVSKADITPFISFPFKAVLSNTALLSHSLCLSVSNHTLRLMETDRLNHLGHLAHFGYVL